ncbi:MAG: hypothetical protein WC856_13725 [Methylococcaceae bacterium]|jgi:hypothetical protein
MRKSYFSLDDYPVTYADTQIHARFMRGLIFFLIVMFLLLMLTSCSIMNYTGKNPDGSETHAWGIKLGTDSAIKDFAGTVSKDGSRSITLGSSDSNQSAGMAQANQFISTIVEGAVKGAAAGFKP